MSRYARYENNNMCVLCWSKLTYSLAGIQISSVDRIECYAGLRWIIYAISVEEKEKDGKKCI